MVLKFLSWLRDNAQGVWMNRINFEKATRQREQRARGGGLDIFELATRQRAQRARGVDGLKILSWLCDNAHNATTRKGGCRGEILKLDLWFN